jgi:hypothetical protein
MKWEKNLTIAFSVLAITAFLTILASSTYRYSHLRNRALDEGVTDEEMLNHPADRYWVHVTCWNCKGRVSYEPLRGQPKEECLWRKECLRCGLVNTNDRHGE